MKAQRLLDLAASKPGIYLGLVLLVASFLAATGHFIHQYDDFLRQRSTFLGLKMREGFVALSDLQRINLIILDAQNQGEMNDDLTGDLAHATDFLFVRAEAFRQSVTSQTESAEAQEALAHIDEVIALLDDALASEDVDLAGLSARLIWLTDETRRLLFIFLDEQRRAQQLLVTAQSEKLRQQSLYLTGFMFFLTVVAGGALLLVLREMRLRQHVEEAEGRAQYLAYFDSLTGLPNRSQFQDTVIGHLDAGSAVTMIFADLDNFKGINDSLGHAAGDTVLRVVADILHREADRAGGLAARIAGDEFAIFVPETDPDHLSHLADAIQEAMNDPVVYEGETLDVGLSLGIAPGDRVARAMPLNFENLSRIADFCLYASKSAGRNRSTMFDDQLKQQFIARRAMLTELTEAIRMGEIEVWFQPKVALGTEALLGFEALCRWFRGGTLVPPGEFIPIAEASGSVVDLDLYVMRRSCQVLAAWNRAVGCAYSVSVNLSAVHFRSGAIVESIDRILYETKLPPQLLTLEITETVQLVNWDMVGGIIAEIRKLGCQISIDDFGSGYSSLAYLRTMQADELKIDRTLIAEIECSEEARHVLSSVVDLAQSLNMRVIVEGVENEAQAAILSCLGSVFGQGYLFGRPMPAERALARFATTVALKDAS